MERREGIVFYRDWWEALQNLPDNMQLAAFRAICLYGFDGVAPEDVVVDSITKLMQTAIDRNDKKWEDVREKRKAAANARWSRIKELQQSQEDANACKSIFCNANDAIKSNIKIKSNNTLSNNACASARERVCEKIFKECCERFLSDNERAYQERIAMQYGITDLAGAFEDFKGVLIERDLLQDVEDSKAFTRLFRFQYCIPRQQQKQNQNQKNNEHGTNIDRLQQRRGVDCTDFRAKNYSDTL